MDSHVGPGTSIVVDNGSGTIKAGLAGKDIPSVVFPSIVSSKEETEGSKDVYIGDVVSSKSELLITAKHPIEFGHVTNWDDMEKVSNVYWPLSPYIDIRWRSEGIGPPGA